MIISGLRLTTASGLARVQAEILWEAAEKPPFTLFVEVHDQFQGALSPDPNAVLIASILPAWRLAERRVRFEEALCPVLCSNVRVALAMLESWYPELGSPPVIESSAGFKAVYPSRPRAISLLSCGIDSLSTLRWNTTNLPSDHPAAIRGVLPVLFNATASSSRSEFEGRVFPKLAAAGAVAEDIGVRLLPVSTNLWWLVNDGYFYDEKWHGAALSAIACFFSRRYHQAYIASGDDPSTLEPWGSHPMLDNYYSSSHFRIEHHGLSMSRLMKTALVGNWPAGLQNLRVCQKGDGWSDNCGTCEKCIRTMTALVALGKLRECNAFPERNVSAELLSSVREYLMTKSAYEASCYKELIPALKLCGRDDLVRAIGAFVVPERAPDSRPRLGRT